MDTEVATVGVMEAMMVVAREAKMAAEKAAEMEAVVTVVGERVRTPWTL